MCSLYRKITKYNKYVLDKFLYSHQSIVTEMDFRKTIIIMKPSKTENSS